MPGFTINHAAISGNLTRDPELRTLPSGTSVCQLRIASNERVKDRDGNWTDRPMYFDITIWSGMGEWVSRNLGKGDGIAVSGRLRWREWEKDVNGTKEKRQAIDIVADSISVGRTSSNSSQRENPDVRQAHSDIPADTTDLPNPSPTDYGDPEDDVPF